MKILLVLFLSTVALAADAPKPPTLTIDQQSKLQALIIREQQLQLQLKQLESDYKTASTQLQGVQQEMNAAKDDVCKGLKIAPDACSLTVDRTGTVVLPPKTVVEKK